MRRGPDEIGPARRFAVMLFGLLLASKFNSHSVGGSVLGLLGLVIVLAGLGAAELAMAVWYRAKRHRLVAQRPVRAK